MARKQAVQIQECVTNDEEFEEYIEQHKHQLICVEVFSEFSGHCLALAHAVRKGKLEIGGDDIAMVRAQCDKITVLARFRDKSEPAFIFLQEGKLTNAVFGADGIVLLKVIEDELKLMKRATEEGLRVNKMDIDERLPIEKEKAAIDEKLDKQFQDHQQRLRTATNAARKQRICQRLSMFVKRFNFIVFWPHNHKAHYDLYERWDGINIHVAAKEEYQFDDNSVKELLYMSDLDGNEAMCHALKNGPALIVLFRVFESDDRDFVQVLRHALYVEIPEPKPDLPPDKQPPLIPAYEQYATISKTARQVRRDRYNEKLRKEREAVEEAERIKREQERLAREAEEERQRQEKQRQEEARFAKIAAGLPPSEAVMEPEPVEGEGEGGEGEEGEQVEGEEGEKENEEGAAEDQEKSPEEQAEAAAQEGEEVVEEAEPEPVFNSDEEQEDEEYIPPGGLFIPGLYAPPNELAKANGLKHFFVRNIKGFVPENVMVDPEQPPPHVLVIFTADKRHDIMEVVEQQFQQDILQMGLFVGDDPFKAEHVAYTLKQYEKMVRPRKHLDRLALSVSRKRSLPLLTLAAFNPIYISSDNEAGERDCLALFPVGYGDDYEDEESVHEEAVVEEEVVQKVESVPPSKVSVKPSQSEGGMDDFGESAFDLGE